LFRKIEVAYTNLNVPRNLLEVRKTVEGVRGMWLPGIQVDSRMPIFDRHPSLIYMYIRNYGDTHQPTYLRWWLE
jgi:hypothetical protein